MCASFEIDTAIIENKCTVFIYEIVSNHLKRITISFLLLFTGTESLLLLAVSYAIHAGQIFKIPLDRMKVLGTREPQPYGHAPTLIYLYTKYNRKEKKMVGTLTHKAGPVLLSRIADLCIDISSWQD